MKLTAIIEKGEKYWIGQIAELPAALSQGRTKKELIENLKEAAKLVIKSNREDTIKNITKHRYEQKNIYVSA